MREDEGFKLFGHVFDDKFGVVCFWRSFGKD